MPAKAPPTLAAVLGSNIRKARSAKGWSQETLANRARSLGLRWSRSTIAALENGTKTLDLAEFILLVATLDSTLPELLSGDERIELGDRRQLTMDQVRIILTSDMRRSPKEKPSSVMAGVIHDTIEPAEMDAYEDFWWRVGDAERKAARKLELSLKSLDALAFATWGRTLTEERDARIEESSVQPLSTRTIQALRGHMTRQLLVELEAAIQESPQRKSRRRRGNVKQIESRVH